MRNKRLLRTLSALCLTLVLASGFTVHAFAQGAAPPRQRIPLMTAMWWWKNPKKHLR